MKIIIWLWNPWDNYNKTRHNAGFMFLDYLVEKLIFPDFKNENKFKAEISSWNLNWEKTLLVKPHTYMNLSWDSIREIANFYKLKNDDFIVIYDDISMDFGKLRFRDKWSAWWQNWIKSIIKHFWDLFDRIKIWIWLNTNYEVSDWVLSRFKSDEIENLEKEIFPKVYDILMEKI